MLCLGDSYTIGESVNEDERFPVQTISILDQKHIHFNPPEIIARTGWTTGELQHAVNAKSITENYDIVTLLIGVNNQYRNYNEKDYAAEFEQLLKQAIQFSGNKPNHVFVLSIPDWGITPFAIKDPRSQAELSSQIDSFNSINKKISDQYEANYIDITPISRVAITDNSLLANDGLHPSGKMYKLWAELLAPEILSALDK